MEFLRLAKRRSVFSETIYILLNIGLAVSILVSILVVQSPLLAFGLVIVSKWRVFAVRPRYWWAHVQANIVDLVVSCGFVVLLYTAGHSMAPDSMFVQIALTLLYIAWILFLKPRTKRVLVAAQAGVALFVGTTALYSSAYGWPAFVVVGLMFVFGYAAARHVLAAYDEEDLTFLSLLWGLIIAQLGWVGYHWTMAYSVPFVDTLHIPQVAIIVLAVSFLIERIYACYVTYKQIRWSDIAFPVILSASIIIVILFLFNGMMSSNI